MLHTGWQRRNFVSYLKKVAHTRLLNVGFRSWSRFLAVSLQMTRVIKPAVGCHYFPPGLQLPSQPLRGLLPISLLGERRHDGCEQFAKDCGCDLNPGPTAPESSTLTTRLSSHPVWAVSYLCQLIFDAIFWVKSLINVCHCDTLCW